MRVLALVTDAFGGYGGIAQYNRDFLSALAAMPGTKMVEVLPRLAPEAPGVLPAKIVQHDPVRSPLRYALAAMRRAISTTPDVIVSAHLYHGPLAWLIARVLRVRLVSQLHGTEVWKPLSWRHRWPLAGSDLVLAVSRDTLDRAAQQLGHPLVAGAVLPNTVRPEFVPGDRCAARRRFRIADETVLLTVARLDGRRGYKGHDRVIPLVRQFRDQGRDVIYLIAGVGEDQPRLEALAHAHGVTEQVRFLGKVPDCDLPDLYRAADLFVLPSTGEGFGIVYLEAMACGTPAIGLRVGGAPDALDDLGVCVSPEDFPHALEVALGHCHRDPVALSEAVDARFGQTAFQRKVADLFTAPTGARQ